MRVLPVLLFVASLVHAASLQERADAAFARVPLRSDQEAQYGQILQDYYQRQSDMYKRSARQSSGSELDKLVKKRSHKISSDTVKKMGKVLDAKQLEEFRYAIDLADRSFIEGIPTE